MFPLPPQCWATGILKHWDHCNTQINIGEGEMLWSVSRFLTSIVATEERRENATLSETRQVSWELLLYIQEAVKHVFPTQRWAEVQACSEKPAWSTPRHSGHVGKNMGAVMYTLYVNALFRFTLVVSFICFWKQGCAKVNIKAVVFTCSMKSSLGDTCILVGAHQGFKKTAVLKLLCDVERKCVFLRFSRLFRLHTAC